MSQVTGWPSWDEILAEKVEAARREEREACAKIADDHYYGVIASAIRARSTTDGKQAEPAGPKKEKP